MARAKTSLKSSAARRNPTVFNWTTVGIIAVYCVLLTAGLLLYRSIPATTVSTKAASNSKSEQIGQIIIVTPDGCRSGEFDNSKPADVALSRRPCDEALGSLGSSQSPPQSGDARIKAIGRYFRGAE